MSKTKLLLDVVEDIKSLGVSLEAFVAAFETAETAPVAVMPKQLEVPVANSKITKPKVTLEEVRAVLARKSQAGFTVQIKSIIQRFDAKKLSDVNPAYYEEILLSAEELSHE